MDGLNTRIWLKHKSVPGSYKTTRCTRVSVRPKNHYFTCNYRGAVRIITIQDLFLPSIREIFRTAFLLSSSFKFTLQQLFPWCNLSPIISDWVSATKKSHHFFFLVYWGGFNLNYFLGYFWHSLQSHLPLSSLPYSTLRAWVFQGPPYRYPCLILHINAIYLQMTICRGMYIRV